MKTSENKKKNKFKIAYPSLLSPIYPVSDSYEISVRIFVQQSSFKHLDHDKELNDSNDTDFEIEKDSIRKGFDQH